MTTPEIENLAQAIAAELGVGYDEAVALARAAEPLWDVMARLGWTDGYAGMECQRVLPAALSFIHREANRGPTPVELN